MEQIAAKVASLVVPPAQQHRGEKPSEEKGRQPGEARRRPLERSTVEVKGAGGILVLGGLLVTAAVAAGVTIVARRAQAKRTPASKKEKAEGLNGNDKLGESRIDGSADIQDDDCVSVKPKSSSFEAVTCDGVEELGNGRELGWQQLDEKNWGKTDLRLQNGIGKKEIDKQGSLGEVEHGMIDKEDDKESELGMNQQQTEELVNTAKICLAREEEDKDSVNHNETELKESIPAWGNGEKDDEPSLKQPHVDEQISEPELALVNEEQEPKEPRFHMIESEPFALKEVKALSVGQQIEDVLNERGIERIEEHIEEKEETEASPEGNEEKIEKETEESPEGEKDEEEIEDDKEPKASPEAEGEEIEEKKGAEVSPEEKEHEEIEDKKETESTSPEGEEKAEDEEAIEEKKEPGSSVKREDDGTYSNQTQPHMIHSEVSTEEFSTTKKIEETDEKAQPASCAEEEEESNDNQTQTLQVIDEHKQQKEHEILIVQSEDKVNQHQTEQISGSELAEKEGVKALSIEQQTEHVLNEHDLAKVEEHVEEKEETEASPEGNEEKIEEKKEAEESPEGEEDEEEIEDEKEPKTSPEEEEKVEDEEAIEEKKEPGSSVKREDDGTYSSQTQPHIIHDEKAQPAPCAEEEEESNDNQTQTSQVIDEHMQQKEHEILIVQSEVKVNQHQTEQISGSELAEKEGVKALSIEQQTGHVLNEHDLAKLEEHVEEKEETEAFPEGNEEKIEEKKEAEESPEGEDDEEEIEDEKEPKTSPEEEEKVEDEEAIEEKKEPESSVEGEDDGTYNNQTQPHIIHSEVSTEEVSTTKELEEINEKAQPASFAEEEEGSNDNQTRTHTADSQFSTEDYSTVKQVEKMDNAKEEPESFPEQEAQMRDEGSDSTPVSSAESNEAAISPAEVVDQGKILLHEVESKVSSDYLKSSGEVKVKVHVKKAEEKQQESIAERENTLDNMVHANKAEEKAEERKITKDEMQQQLMATIREKSLMLEKLLMDIPDRLLVVLLVISVTMVLLHYAKPFSQLYQMISPSEENSKGI